jgi:predicted flap endonuclease-1-like 5' DNA nuclease
VDDLEEHVERLTAELAAAREEAGAAERLASELQAELTARQEASDDADPDVARLRQRIAAQAEALAEKEARIALLSGGTAQEPDEPDAPDDLQKIWGIGPAIERTLHGLGIVSIKQVAELTGPRLPEVKEALGDFQDRVERDAWSAQARTLLDQGEARSAPAPEPTGEGPDDLKRIWGIGPAIERTLHDLGIVSFEQVANLAEPQLSRVRRALGAFEDRIEADAWQAQARRLAGSGGLG